MEKIKLPEILNIPPKLLPLLTEIDKYNYFLVEGGRSAAKSQSIARILLWLAEKKKVRIVCGREIQKTIDESVYTLFKDLINSYSLAFDVLKTTIEHKVTQSPIRFRGFREQGALNIMGLEGCDILWVEQAESVTKTTLDVILPTIRKNKSKVFFSMNRHVELDPVFIALANRRDCLHIHINYPDNPFCPQKAILEAEICKQKNYDDYCHIWLGEPLSKSEDYLFSIDAARESLALDMERIGINRRIIANDAARYGDCETVFTLLESRGPVLWEQTYLEAYKNKGLDETLGRSLSMQKEFGADALVIDDDGIGGGITDMLGEPGFEVIPFRDIKDYEHEMYFDRRTEGYFKLKDWMEKGWLKILNDSVLIEQLMTIRYKYKSNGKICLITKDEMRKAGIVSPDRSDALMMAVYYADKLMGQGFSQPAYAAMHTDLGFDNFRFDKFNPEYAGQ